METQIATRKHLRIPYDKQFFNLPISHYSSLAEEIGTGKVLRHVRSLILEYKHDQRIAGKARLLVRKLDPTFLSEAVAEEDAECECGFLLLGQEYESCPVCGKHLYEGKLCYYKDTTGDQTFCTIDGQDCKWNSYSECGKLDEH